MESKKRLSFDDPSAAAASALRLFTRSPTGHRLGQRRPSTTCSSAPSVTSSMADELPASCVSCSTSGDQCALYRFIVWAAVKRNACRKMTPEQRRECPLLRCRKKFPNHELMLQHLYTCDHLAGGEYWYYDSLWDKPKSQSLAIAAAHLDVQDEPPSYDSAVFMPSQAELSSNEIHEIGSSEVLLPHIPECVIEIEADPAAEMPPGLPQSPFPTSPLSHHAAGLQPATLEAGLINWGPLSSPLTVAPQNLIRPSSGRLVDRPILQLHTHGLDQYRLQAKRRSKALAPSTSVRSTSSTDSTDSTNSTNSTNSTESYSISPVSGWSRGWSKVSGLDSALTSPDDLVSPGDIFSTDPFKGSRRPVPLSVSDLDNVVANSCPSELPADIPMFDLPTMDPLQDTLNVIQPTFFDTKEPVHMPISLNVPPKTSRLLLQATGRNLVNAQPLVASAQDALQMHIANSMTRLKDIDKNHLVPQFRGMPPTTVALVGLETMMDVLEGRQATSPVKLLCFIHVIFSLSLVVHEQDAPKRCTGLFTQAMLYRSWFSNHDRAAYIEVVYTLWKPHETSDADIISLLQPAATSMSEKGKEPERHQGLLFDPLVFIAKYFLDELDYSALHENSQPEIQASELAIQHLRETVPTSKGSPFSIAAKFTIESFLCRQHVNVPGFTAGVKRLIDQVDSGPVSSVRRLELELMQAGKMHLPSDMFFDSFIEEVRRLLDPLYALAIAYSSSRSTYHRYGIRLMESLIRRSDDDRTTAENAVPMGRRIDPIVGAMPADLGNLDFDEIIDFGPEQDIYPNAPDQAVAVDASRFDVRGWKTAPILDMSDSPAEHFGTAMASEASASGHMEASTSTQSTLIKVESDSCCKLCGYRPKGDPRWFIGSMAKHMRTIHSETPKIYRCPYPGCTSQYSKRADNLRQHQIEKGHFVEGQGTNMRRPSKRKRASEGE